MWQYFWIFIQQYYSKNKTYTTKWNRPRQKQWAYPLLKKLTPTIKKKKLWPINVSIFLTILYYLQHSTKSVDLRFEEYLTLTKKKLSKKNFNLRSIGQSCEKVAIALGLKPANHGFKARYGHSLLVSWRASSEKPLPNHHVTTSHWQPLKARSSSTISVVWYVRTVQLMRTLFG